MPESTLLGVQRTEGVRPLCRAIVNCVLSECDSPFVEVLRNVGGWSNESDGMPSWRGKSNNTSTIAIWRDKVGALG